MIELDSLLAIRGRVERVRKPFERMNSGDTIIRAGNSESSKFTSHSGTAVAPGVAVRMDVSIIWSRSCSFARLRLLGSRLRALWYPERDTPRASQSSVIGKFFRIEINQRIPLCGSSESMLIAFFKISRWRCRYSFSRCRWRISPAGSARGDSLRPFESAEAACATRPLPRVLFSKGW